MILEKTLRWLVISCIFLLTLIPFIVAGTLFFPYITGKNFTFRIIVEIMAGGWLTLALINPAYRPRRSWILAAFSVFVFVIAIADAFGVYPFKSFWSNYERMDGWVTLAHLLVYLFVTASIMTTEKLWRWLFYASLALSACVSVYGFLQILGISAIGNNSAGGLGARIDATFGNPIYLAVYMLFHIFIALWLWSRVWEERGVNKRLWISFLFGSVIVIDTLILFFTGTRGTMLGLLGGSLLIAVLLVLFLRSTKGEARTPSLAWRIAVGYIIFMILAAGSFWAVRDAEWVKRVGFLNRLATISSSENGVKARFINWSTAWNGVKERPLLGWGQENFAIVFDKYYDPRMYAQEPWFDRVHNIIFDWLIAGGFFGLLSYLSIFAATLWALWRPSGERGSTESSRSQILSNANVSNVRKGFSTVEASIFTGLLAGYFFHNFFVFDNIMSYILFVTVLGYIAWRSSVAHAASSLWSGAPRLWRGAFPRKFAPFLALAIAALVLGAGYSINAAGYAQNKLLLQSLVSQKEGVAKNLELIKSSISKGSFGTQEAREQLAQVASKMAGATGVDTAQKQAFYDAAVSEMKLQEEASPLDARFPLFLGITYDAFGNYAAGADALQRAHELSLKKQSILFEIAQNARARGDSSAVLQAYKTAYTLDTSYMQARIYYGAALIAAGNNALAKEILAPVIAVWEEQVKANPADPQAYFTLAAGYYETGNIAKAISTLEAASAISPDVAKQAAAFIEQIKNGIVKVQ